MTTDNSDADTNALNKDYTPSTIPTIGGIIRTLGESQQKHAKEIQQRIWKSMRDTATPQTPSVTSNRCSTDYQCGRSELCIKRPNEYNGVCMQKVVSYRNKNYDRVRRLGSYKRGDEL